MSLYWTKPKEIPVVIHNGSTYDYHFIIKQLAKEFDGQFECLGDSFRFMSTSLSNLVDNVSEIYRKKFKDKNCKSRCNFIGLKNIKLKYKCKKKMVKNSKRINQNVSKCVSILQW